MPRGYGRSVYPYDRVTRAVPQSRLARFTADMVRTQHIRRKVPSHPNWGSVEPHFSFLDAAIAATCLSACRQHRDACLEGLIQRIGCRVVLRGRRDQHRQRRQRAKDQVGQRLEPKRDERLDLPNSPALDAVVNEVHTSSFYA